MFGAEAADTLDQSLIGPNAGAAPGSESQFAPAAVTPNDPNQDPNAVPTATAQGTPEAGFLDATVPIAQFSPETASALGISSPSFSGADAAFGNAVGVSPGGVDTGIFGPGNDYSIYTGAEPTDMVDPVADQTLTPSDVTAGKTPGVLDQTSGMLKKLGLTPAVTP